MQYIKFKIQEVKCIMQVLKIKDLDGERNLKMKDIKNKCKAGLIVRCNQIKYELQCKNESMLLRPALLPLLGPEKSMLEVTNLALI